MHRAMKKTTTRQEAGINIAHETRASGRCSLSKIGGVRDRRAVDERDIAIK